MKYLAILPLGLILVACSGVSAPQFTLDKPGAACIHGQIDSDNPVAEASTRGTIVEINTGDETPVTPEDIASVATALGCVSNAR